MCVCRCRLSTTGGTPSVRPWCPPSSTASVRVAVWSVLRVVACFSCSTPSGCVPRCGFHFLLACPAAGFLVSRSGQAMASVVFLASSQLRLELCPDVLCPSVRLDPSDAARAARSDRGECSRSAAWVPALRVVGMLQRVAPAALRCSVSVVRRLVSAGPMRLRLRLVCASLPCLVLRIVGCPAQPRWGVRSGVLALCAGALGVVVCFSRRPLFHGVLRWRPLHTRSFLLVRAGVP